MLDERREGNDSLRDALDRLQHAEKLIAIGRLAAASRTSSVPLSNTLRTISLF